MNLSSLLFAVCLTISALNPIKVKNPESLEETSMAPIEVKDSELLAENAIEEEDSEYFTETRKKLMQGETAQYFVETPPSNVEIQNRDCFTSLPTDPIKIENKKCPQFKLSNFFNERCTINNYLSMTFGKSIGVDKSYGSLATFITKLEKDYLYFFDGRWHYLCDGSNGINAGLGIRFGNDCKGCGANVYYDWRHYRSKNFQQVEFGIEGWIRPWEFQLRFYQPWETSALVDKSTITYPGGYFFTKTTTAYTCHLATLLAGRRFNLCNRYFSDLPCRILAGPYWISRKHNEHRYGGLASFDLEFYDYFSLKGVGSYDPIFRSRFELTVSINIPFGCRTRSPCECPSDYNLRRPERLDLIPIKKVTDCKYNWNSP